MDEITGDIWDYHKQGNWIVITTNGTVKKNGECVMGRGIALQAKIKIPTLPVELGELIHHFGNKLFMFGEYKILTFPVKHNWWEKANLALISENARELAEFANLFSKTYPIYLPRPGCGNGKLDWKDVKPILEKYLDDRFIIVQM